MKNSLLATALLLATAAPAWAHEHGHDHDHSQGHAAHVHGQATLLLVVDKGQVQATLESPLDNLLGFEHAPRTDKERQAVRQMAKALQAPDTLLSFDPQAGCKLERTQLNSAVLPASLLQGDQAAPAAGAADAGHGDLELEASYQCQNPPRTIDVRLFKHFKRLQRLNVEIVSEKEQAARQLNPAQPRIKLD